MSGILGVFHLNGAPAAVDLSSMAPLLQRRGPDRTGLWSDGPVGLGHTLLATTPELASERQPVVHAASGCVITADVRLDNRDELLEALGMADRSGRLGDAGLILEAYLAWGEDCVGRLLGDFAFAVWDPRRCAVFCARDHFGMRPFYYHFASGTRFALASEPRAILVVPQVPCQINEGRIADFLVPELEWIDYTSTFFQHVVRLPPAHVLTVTSSGIHPRRYWTLEPGSELRLSSNEAYAEALLDVLTVSVRARLRGAGPVGSMLSGGLDSSSVVALARGVLRADNRRPISTFSAVGPDKEACPETRAAQAVLAQGGLDPHVVDYGAIGDLLPELEGASWDLDEPFDFIMALVRTMYLDARRQGNRVVLDGAGSDAVLNEGTHIARLFRQGRWSAGWREARAQDRFHGISPSFVNPLRIVRAALTPDFARRLVHPLRHARRTRTAVRCSIISPEFARRMSLADRLETLDRTFQRGWHPNPQLEHAAAIHPNMTAGRERYGRVASVLGVEPRDPFMDRRVVAFCLTLPASQRCEGGWPKVILRRAMAGRLPDEVRWRRGRQHLGWGFVRSAMTAGANHMRHAPDTLRQSLGPFVKPESLSKALSEPLDVADPAFRLFVLSAWLEGASGRPIAKTETHWYTPACLLGLGQ